MTSASRARAALALALPQSARTDHLTEDEIALYHRDRLEPAEQERAMAHLSECAECSRLVLAFADFDDPEAALPLSEFEQAAAWRLVRPRRDEVTGVGAASTRPRRGFVWPAVAASLLATTLAAGFYAQRLGRDLAIAQAPELNTPVVDLFATHRRSIGPEAPPLRLPLEAASLLVVLNPERRESFPDYSLEMRSAAGTLLWQGRGLRKNEHGSFTVSLPTSLLTTSPLGFTLFGEGPTGREPLGSYRLELDLP